MDSSVISFSIGLICAILAAFAAWLIHRKRHPGKKQYDERQIAGQGKAYKAGFFTLLVAGSVCSILERLNLLPGSVLLWGISVQLLGIAVFAVTAIHFDSYIAINQSYSRFVRIGCSASCAWAATLSCV